MLQLKGKLKIRRNLILRSGETTLLILTPQIKSWLERKEKVVEKNVTGWCPDGGERM